MSGEVEGCWASSALGDLFALNTPGHWGDEPDGDGNALVLRSTNFRKTGGLVYETAAPRQFDQRKLLQKRLQPGDIILERSGGSPAQPVGRARRFEAKGCYSASNFMQIMRPSDQMDDWFTSYLLDFIYDQGLTEALQKATTGIRNLDFKTYLELPVSLPPLDEQRRIAEVLRSVDEAIAANEAAAVQARRAYQAALADLVGSENHHWETARLGELATFVNGRGFKPHEWGDEGFPIIRIQNLNGGTDFNYYSGNFNPKILVRPGDLLFAWSGSRGTSFGPHIWRGPEGVLNYHTWNVVPKLPEDRDYLYFALRQLTKKIEDEAHGASALVHMQKAYVVDYEIELPPPEERMAIAATLSDLLEAANHADQVHGEVMATKGHLLGDLLSGRVRVPA